LLPDVDASTEVAWQDTFAAALEAAGDEDRAAALLLDFMTDPEKNAQFHQDQAKQLLATCQERLQDEESVSALYGLLAQKRMEVFASEISMSPGGQILEPGFRVIFPDVSPQPAPWSLVLTTACEVVATSMQ
jgi:hypothetical protein